MHQWWWAEKAENWRGQRAACCNSTGLGEVGPGRVIGMRYLQGAGSECWVGETRHSRKKEVKRQNQYICVMGGHGCSGRLTNISPRVSSPGTNGATLSADQASLSWPSCSHLAQRAWPFCYPFGIKMKVIFSRCPRYRWSSGWDGGVQRASLLSSMELFCAPWTLFVSPTWHFVPLYQKTPFCVNPSSQLAEAC